jgi:hypothetical protein
MWAADDLAEWQVRGPRPPAPPELRPAQMREHMQRQQRRREVH